MKANITEDKIKALLQDAARKLSGHKKRSFMAKVAIDLYEENGRGSKTIIRVGKRNYRKRDERSIKWYYLYR